MAILSQGKWDDGRPDICGSVAEVTLGNTDGFPDPADGDGVLLAEEGDVFGPGGGHGLFLEC